MPLLTIEALILRNLRFGDTSRVVNVLSRQQGRFGAVAKSVRVPKSRFGAALEILNVSSLLVYYRPGRDLQLISEGTLEREFRGLLRDAERYHYGCAVLEFLDRVIESEASVPEIFDLSVRVLDLMETSPVDWLAYLFRAFQLRSAGWLGYSPRLAECVFCGSAQVNSFAPAEGGVSCSRCASSNSARLPMGEPTRRILRRLSQGALPQVPDRSVITELDAIAETFLAYHLDRYRGLRSIRLLGGDLGSHDRRAQTPSRP